MSPNTRPITRAQDQGRNPAGEGEEGEAPIEEDSSTVGEGPHITSLGSASPPNISQPEARELPVERRSASVPRDASTNPNVPLVDTPQDELPLLFGGMIKLLREREARSRLLAQSAPDMPRLWLEIPKYAGYADTKSVTDFLFELRDYRAASGIF
ncbi:hypothetical protein ANAPC5_01485 [Anaplasma phagocytophilum]|nr:hypothetical protein ANAPC5_01485 [Anaplasma phagocytophilum]